jgi:A118 family predicted phage portal protein
MAFLKENSQFPPSEWSFWMNKYQEWATWYSGEPENLRSYYSKLNTDIFNEMFWSKASKEGMSGAVHLPAAGDIATTSANLLFSESPKIVYDESKFSGERIKTFISENGFQNTLLEGAEIAAAMSGCILKLDIEPDLVGVPVVSIVTPAQFFPTFWRGRLWEVLFFRVVKETNEGLFYRLFENRRREGRNCIIEYELYKGSVDKVGIKVDINILEETSVLSLENVVYENIDGLGCVYVPNMRPNKIVPGSSLGINDYSSSITLLHSLDFTWTSWMRDLELGMAQIFIDEELLTKNKSDINGVESQMNRFSKYTKSFMKINLTAWKMSGDTGAKPIDNIQFDVRVDEHAKTCTELFAQIINQCGYSTQTFGFGDSYGNAESGAALRMRERKSQLTREKKSRYWKPVIIELLKQAQKIDQAANLQKMYEIDESITIELEDSIVIDSMETSEVIRNLEQARAISTYAKVKMLHPDWEEADIENEVNQINKESGITGEVISDEV